MVLSKNDVGGALMEMYEVVDLGTWTVVARGFRTREEAEQWGWDNDCGQWDAWTVYDYWADVDFT